MPNDVMKRAVEAGARAAQPYAFDDAFWLVKQSPDHHQRHAQSNARIAAEAAIRAALPVIGVDLLGLVRERVDGERELLAPARAANDRAGALVHSEAMHTAAEIGAALRARLAEMMEQG